VAPHAGERAAPTRRHIATRWPPPEVSQCLDTGAVMSSILSPHFYPATRILSRVILAVMLISVLFAFWRGIANWLWIGV
jgi:hypothetical protein